jgi:hypothetical protein
MRAAGFSDRAPEVVIRVVSAGSNNLPAIRWHLRDIAYGKHRMLETDDGEQIADKAAASRLIEDWDLDLDELTAMAYFPARHQPRKLVHKLLFSMPAGTSPGKLFAAVRGFAREAFGFDHRYALALHTDEPNPHVHLVLRVENRECIRLNIRKAMLHSWRLLFAYHLRAQGVAAEATRRVGRSAMRRPCKVSGMLRPVRKPDSPRIPQKRAA